MKCYRGYWSVVAVMIAATCALAQTRPEPVASVPVQDVAVIIAPFVDDQTVLVAHADVMKIDTAAALAFVQKVLPQFDSSMSPDGPKKMEQARAMAESFLAAFKQAGGRHAFYVMAHSDAWPAMQGGAALIPLEAGRDPQIMITLLKPFCGPMVPVLLNDNVIAIGPQAPVERLKGIKASARADIVQALSVAPKSAVRVSLTPTADHRRVLREMMPALPVEIGGGSTEFIHDGLTFVSVGLVWPPEIEVAVRMEFASPEYAQRAADAIKQAINLALEKKENKELLERPEAQAVREYVNFASSPKVSGTTLSYVADEKTLTDVVIKVLAPSLERARQQAKRTMSMSNIKQLMVAIYCAQNDLKAWPENLETVNQPYLSGKLATIGFNPADPKKRPYVYRKPSADELKKIDTMSLPVIWEQVDDDVTPVNVGFADGHVEMFKGRVEARKAFERVGITLP